MVGIQRPSLDMELSLRQELRLQLFGDRAQLRLPQGMRLTAHMGLTDGAKGAAVGLQSLAITLNAPIHTLEPPPIQATLRRVTILPGYKAQFEVDAASPNERAAILRELDSGLTRPLIDLLNEHSAEVPLLRDFLEGKTTPRGGGGSSSVEPPPPLPPPPPGFK